jgi:AsmA protein
VKRALLATGAVLGLLLAAAVALPFLFPLESWKPEIRSRVKAATGRDLRLDGPMRLVVLPRLELSLSDVGLSHPPGPNSQEWGSPEMVSLKEVSLVMELWPLFSGRLEVNRVELDRPVLALEVDAAGKPNWSFDRAAGQADAPKGEGTGGLLQMDFSDVRVADGTLRYTDRRSGATQEATDVGVKLSLPVRDGPLQAVGALAWKGGRISLDATVASPRVLMRGGESSVRARIASERVRIAWNGALTIGPPLHVAGDLDLVVPSVRGLAAWSGVPLDLPPGTFEELKLRGKAEGTHEAMTFRDATVALDGMEATGRVAVALSGKKPRIDAVLDGKALDLTRLLPTAAPRPAEGAAPRGGWSGEPFTTTALRAVDASLALSVESLVTPRVRAGRGSLSARLEGGRLTLDLKELALHEGSVHGTVALDAPAAGPVGVQADLHLAGVQVEPLLRDASDGNWMAGRGTFDVKLRGRGSSVREVIGSLEGNGALDLRDGAIRGINLAAMVLNVAAAFQKKGEGDRTEFSRLHGSFRVAGGVLQNSDLVLDSSVLKATGEGKIDLGRRQMDYRVSPTFVAPVVGQVTGGLVSMKVPVLIRGPWDNLVYAPDLVGLIREGVTAPVNILKGAKDFTRGLFDR